MPTNPIDKGQVYKDTVVGYAIGYMSMHLFTQHVYSNQGIFLLHYTCMALRYNVPTNPINCSDVYRMQA